MEMKGTTERRETGYIHLCSTSDCSAQINAKQYITYQYTSKHPLPARFGLKGQQTNGHKVGLGDILNINIILWMKQNLQGF